MSEKKRSYIIYLVFSLLLAGVIITWLASSFTGLEKKETNIDRLFSGLYVTRMLLPETAEISVMTNMDEAHQIELLAQSQYVLAPRLVVTDTSAAYILVVEDPRLPALIMKVHPQICSVSRNDLNYILLKR
jgi:hypothetical protein